ncbi:MATE family efflux transporter [Phenylobacterium sp. Root700]|uniref:MATE family efflux transporter n=2 Tax=unclassified Phenylobacterium TaxID=2640670 RepID=UPI0006F94942|nr:MATE family efflux transporter [Phenylobacterium sp. Root700]KRB40456.1 MATE family efflux transporter [Phenylobacterium sp. Root700]MBT9474199.1 MATE family efflux transporter [Phenylobacterium sp.]
MQDLTTGPIAKTLILFALPVMGSNILQSLNGSANAIWVSHVLGEAALTATVNANNIFFLMLGTVFGISMAANLLISQSVGGGDLAMVKRVVGSATSFFLVLSLAVGVAGYLLTPSILRIMQTPPDATRDAIIYLRVIFVAMPFMYFFSFVMMAQRGAGDSKTPFWFSVFAVGLDVILNPLLIIGVGPFPKLGIAGSATATLISQTLTLAAMVVYLYRTDSVLILKRQEWRLLLPELTIIKTLVMKGFPMALQMLVISGAAVVMIRFVNAYGSATAAGYGAAIQLWTYIQMPAMALGAAVSSMAAQNVGAGKMDRVGAVARQGVLIAAVMTATPVLLIYLVEPWVLLLFLPASSPSTAIAMHINSFVLWGFIPFGMAFVLNGIIRATGAVWPPLLGLLVSMWIVRIPFAQFMEPYLGQDAIWWSFPLGSMISLVLAAAYYRWGGWRKARLMEGLPRGSAPDTGLGTPMLAEETEAVEEAARAQDRASPAKAPAE